MTRRPRPTVLLRSSWQTVNIGDMAHSPGAITALSASGVDVILWPRQFAEREREMFEREFPDVTVVEGQVSEGGVFSTSELRAAWESADVLVHGSAATIVEREAFELWRASGRPYGYFGVTVDPFAPFVGGTLTQLAAMSRSLPPTFMEEGLRGLLSAAAFVYCRESLSLEYLAGQGVSSEVLELGADATFAFIVQDEEAAENLLGTMRLDSEDFLCVVPRNRFASYHRYRGYPPETTDLLKEAINAAHTPDDLGVLARVITAWIRDTGQPVLVCPEMEHNIELAITQLVPLLPADVRDRVHVVAEFWSPETAAAVYSRAHAVVSMECHSPILALGADTPVVYLRLPTETFKGEMFADLGLDCVVELGPSAAEQVVEVLRSLRSDTAAEARGIAVATAQSRLADMADQVRAVSAAQK